MDFKIKVHEKWNKNFRGGGSNKNYKACPPQAKFETASLMAIHLIMCRMVSSVNLIDSKYDALNLLDIEYYVLELLNSEYDIINLLDSKYD